VLAFAEIRVSFYDQAMSDPRSKAFPNVSLCFDQGAAYVREPEYAVTRVAVHG